MKILFVWREQERKLGKPVPDIFGVSWSQDIQTIMPKQSWNRMAQLIDSKKHVASPILLHNRHNFSSHGMYTENEHYNKS